MKLVLIILFVTCLTLSVESAIHHKRNKANNLKGDTAPGHGDPEDGNDGRPTLSPVPPASDGEWPQPDHIENFGVPDQFRVGAKRDNESTSSRQQHGKSKHKTHSN